MERELTLSQHKLEIMKRTLLIAASLLFTCALLIGQAKKTINYQAVIRDAEGTPLTDRLISLQFSIINAQEQSLYSEIHQVTSNGLGLINLEIGAGDNVNGLLSEIDWTQDIDLMVEVDTDGGNAFQQLGRSVLSAVPFAYYGEDEDSDPENEMQTISLEGDSLTISDGNSITLDKYISPWKALEDGTGYQLPFGDASSRNNDDCTLTLQKDGIYFRQLLETSAATFTTEYTNQLTSEEMQAIDLPDLDQYQYNLRRWMNRNPMGRSFQESMVLGTNVSGDYLGGDIHSTNGASYFNYILDESTGDIKIVSGRQIGPGVSGYEQRLGDDCWFETITIVPVEDGPIIISQELVASKTLNDILEEQGWSSDLIQNLEPELANVSGSVFKSRDVGRTSIQWDDDMGNHVTIIQYGDLFDVTIITPRDETQNTPSDETQESGIKKYT